MLLAVYQRSCPLVLAQKAHSPTQPAVPLPQPAAVVRDCLLPLLLGLGILARVCSQGMRLGAQGWAG